jgi:hypothetical protein
VIAFSPEDLIILADELGEVSDLVPAVDVRRLVAVLDRIEDLVMEWEAEAARKMREAMPTIGSIYRLKVTLKGIKPPIWRRIEVPDGTLGELHDILQTVMGWDDGHLHQFIVKGNRYGVPSEDGFFMDDTLEEEQILLSQVAGSGGKVRFVYEYDFGDSWHHEIVVEKVLEPEPGVTYPRCTAGARACPPEDCGGIWGYTELLDVLADPDCSEHSEKLEWLGGGFDPDEFSVEEVNEALDGPFR